MQWTIMPNSTELSQKSVTLTIYHLDGVDKLRYVKQNKSLDKKEFVFGNTFRITSNGKYTVEFVTKKEETVRHVFSIGFLDSIPSFAAGDGTSESPYIIENILQLNAIRANLSAWYRLANNIDLDTSEWGLGWCPIGSCKVLPENKGWIPLRFEKYLSFSGVLDGQGYSIANVNSINPKGSNVGLFGFLVGSVHNLTVKNALMLAKSEVGGIAGLLFGEISRCCITGTISGLQHIGGVAGKILGNKLGFSKLGSETIQLSECMFHGTIQGIEEGFATHYAVAPPKNGHIPHLAYSAAGMVGACEGTSTVIENCCIDAIFYKVVEVFGIAGGNPYCIRNCFVTGEIYMEENGVVVGIGNACVGNGKFELLLMIEHCVSAFRKIHNPSEEKLGQSNVLIRRICAVDMQDSVWHSDLIKNYSINYEKTAAYNPFDCPSGTIFDGYELPFGALQDKRFYELLGWDTTQVWDSGNGIPILRSCDSAAQRKGQA